MTSTTRSSGFRFLLVVATILGITLVFVALAYVSLPEIVKSDVKEAFRDIPWGTKDISAADAETDLRQFIQAGWQIPLSSTVHVVKAAEYKNMHEAIRWWMIDLPEKEVHEIKPKLLNQFFNKTDWTISDSDGIIAPSVSSAPRWWRSTSFAGADIIHFHRGPNRGLTYWFALFPANHRLYVCQQESD
jgi:hypothetical protein